MFTLEYAKNPIYVSEDGNAIDLIVKFEEFDRELPFTATTYDTEAHGRDLHARAKAGEFGEIAPYVKPPMPDLQDQPTSDGTQTL